MANSYKINPSDFILPMNKINTSLKDKQKCAGAKIKFGLSKTEMFILKEIDEHPITIVPYGVEEIGSNSFNSIDTRVVILPETVKRIDAYAFTMSRLEELYYYDKSGNIYAGLSDNVVYIGEYAFSPCTNLKMPLLPTGNCTLEKSCFYKATRNMPIQSNGKDYILKPEYRIMILNGLATNTKFDIENDVNVVDLIDGISRSLYYFPNKISFNSAAVALCEIEDKSKGFIKSNGGSPIYLDISGFKIIDLVDFRKYINELNKLISGDEKSVFYQYLITDHIEPPSQNLISDINTAEKQEADINMKKLIFCKERIPQLLKSFGMSEDFKCNNTESDKSECEKCPMHQFEPCFLSELDTENTYYCLCAMDKVRRLRFEDAQLEINRILIKFGYNPGNICHKKCDLDYCHKCPFKSLNFICSICDYNDEENISIDDYKEILMYYYWAEAAYDLRVAIGLPGIPVEEHHKEKKKKKSKKHFRYY